MNNYNAVEVEKGLRKNGFKRRKDTGKYHTYHKFTEFGAGGSHEHAIVPTQQVYDEMVKYLNHLQKLGFEPTKEEDFEKTLSKKYPTGKINVNIVNIDIEDISNGNRGLVEIVIFPHKRYETKIENILEYHNYELVGTLPDSAAEKNGEVMRIGEHELKHIKDDIKFVDSVFRNASEVNKAMKRALAV